MHKYLRHLGDYAKDTKHLSMLEHGAYNQMLDWCYAAEKPLPTDEKALFRLCSAFDKAEQQAVRSIRDEFFVLTEDGYTQKRVLEEIADYKDKAAKATRAADKRWQSERIANAMQTHCVGNADGMPRARVPITDNHKPVTNPLSADADGPRLALESSEDPPSDSPKGLGPQKKKGGAPRQRNEVLEALAIVGGGSVENVTQPLWGAAAKALKSIREVCPEVTAEQIRAAAAAYRDKWPNASCGPMALAKHWGVFGPQKKEGGAAMMDVAPPSGDYPPAGYEAGMQALFGAEWQALLSWPMLPAADRCRVRQWLAEHGEEAA